jgi:hypothetical protein
MKWVRRLYITPDGEQRPHFCRFEIITLTMIVPHGRKVVG